ncbi:MAG: Crp/Fnr family transcriptional regulator, partial [Chloroflexi bacterium]|nr:Crp/Fnr family transcriptional regulator [Chloroflexota bacterium]
MTQDQIAERVRALENVPMFRQLNREVLEVLASRTKRRRFPAGEPIVHEGEAGTTLFIVTDGLVKIAITTPSGSEMVLALLAENQFFGEMALLDGQPRSATAISQETSDLVVLTRQEFIACLTIYPEVAIRLLAELSGRLRRTNRMLSDIATHSLQLRLIHKLLDLADAFGAPHISGGISISV